MVRYSLWTKATCISIPKTKLHLVSCNLCSLSFDSWQLAALLLAKAPQKAMWYPSSKLHVHWLTTLLDFFYSSHSPQLLLLCFGHVGRRINVIPVSNQPGAHWDFLLQSGIWTFCSEKPLENDWLPQCLVCSDSSGLHGSVVKGIYQISRWAFPRLPTISAQLWIMSPAELALIFLANVTMSSPVLIWLCMWKSSDMSAVGC